VTTAQLPANGASNSPAVQIRLLGGVAAATGDGTPVDIGPAKCQAVLAALAMSAGSAVPVSRLVELVWGEEPPRTAEKTLQSYMTRLRGQGFPGGNLPQCGSLSDTAGTVADETLRTELEHLKQELLELRNASPARNPAKPATGGPAAEARRVTTAGLDSAKRLVENLDVPELGQLVADMLKSLGNDVRDSRPKALVAAFLAGVAVGKLLSK
jgi:hypothetical protein